MPKKVKKKFQKRKSLLHKLFPFFPLFLFLGLLVGAYAWYQSRSVPDLGDESEMTALPAGFAHVLGVATSPNAKEQALRIPIFMYHYVESNPTDGREKFNIPPSVLTSQIETLKTDGYTFINAEDLASALAGKRKLPQKSIMLTFDDGYMDFYTEVYPILQKEKIKGVAYIIVNLLDRPNYLFTYQLQEAAKSPYVEIGAHTMDHYGLAGMSKENATYQIVQSRKMLQNMLHVAVNSFAYPYGSFDDQAVQITKDAGFTTAVSVIPGILQTKENKYFLFRLRPGYRSGQVLLDYLKQDTFQPW